MKKERIAVVVSPAEKDDIAQWAQCEGRSQSNYLHMLHKDHKRRALADGAPSPVDVDTAGMAE